MRNPARRDITKPHLHRQQEDGLMNGRWAVLAGSVLVIVMTLGMASGGAADPKCSERTLDGFYVFTASGFQIINTALVPVAIIEQIRFNGDGTAQATGGRVSFGGTILDTLSAATYTIGSLTPPNRGCEGTLIFLGPPVVNLYMSSPPTPRPSS
jgi:hypothetical protein